MPGPRFPLSVALPNGRVRHAARPAAGGRVTTLCRRSGIPTGDGAGLPYCARCRDRPNPIDQRSLAPTASVAPADAAVTGTSPAGHAAERVAAFLDVWDAAPVQRTAPRDVISSQMSGAARLRASDLRALLAERGRLIQAAEPLPAPRVAEIRSRDAEATLRSDDPAWSAKLDRRLLLGELDRLAAVHEAEIARAHDAIDAAIRRAQGVEERLRAARGARLGDPQHTAATPGQPTTAPTTHTVSCLPEDDLDAHSWHVAVEYRGCGLWAVRHSAYCGPLAMAVLLGQFAGDARALEEERTAAPGEAS